MPIRHPAETSRRARGRAWRCLPWLVALTLAFALAACGFGTYDDSGAARPGQWWPWVCPDGGTPDPTSGCATTPQCSGSDPSACVDGGVP